MKRSARLSLKKETLAELSGDDMRGVAGAADASVGTCYTCVVRCVVTPAIDYSVVAPTECCQGIPTFHGMAC